MSFENARGKAFFVSLLGERENGAQSWLSQRHWKPLVALYLPGDRPARRPLAPFKKRGKNERGKSESSTNHDSSIHKLKS